jgi:hypothetical protein
MDEPYTWFDNSQASSFSECRNKLVHCIRSPKAPCFLQFVKESGHLFLVF